MAVDASDLQRLKAAIPNQFQPPQNAGGRLSNDFSTVDSLRESTPLQGTELERFNIGMGYVAQAASNPDQVKPSFLLSGAQANVLAVLAEKQEQKDRNELDFILDQVRNALDARLAALDAELAAIDARLEEIRARREQIGDGLEALDELERLKRQGKLDSNNKDHQRLLRQAGITAEDAMGDRFAAILNQRRRTLDREDGSLATEWNAKMKRRGEVIVEREAVIEAQREIENANTDEARLLAERRANTVLVAQQLGEAALRTKSTEAKLVAADAAGISATSKESNRLAVTDADEFLSQSDDSGWDAPSPSPPKPS